VSQTTTAGLSELDRRIRGALESTDAIEFELRWEVDGRRFVRVRAQRDGTDVRYAWLTDDGTEVRRRLRDLSELEALMGRQLVEPAGEVLSFRIVGSVEPVALFRAMIAAGDRLFCAWED